MEIEITDKEQRVLCGVLTSWLQDFKKLEPSKFHEHNLEGLRKTMNDPNLTLEDVQKNCKEMNDFRSQVVDLLAKFS